MSASVATSSSFGLLLFGTILLLYFSVIFLNIFLSSIEVEVHDLGDLFL